MKIGVIGLGLIGGSMAKEIKVRSLSSFEVFGYDVSEDHAAIAKKQNLISKISTISEICNECKYIIIAIPINRILESIHPIMDLVSKEQIIIDTGSTKQSICESISEHPMRGRFVAAHPLAGTEFSGPTAAIMDLFKGKKNIICENEKTDADALEGALRFFEFLGMDSYFLTPDDHDKHMAYVSHLSHVSSFVLSQTVLDIEKDEKQIFNLASTGFASTARLAKSNAETWGPIFEANAENLVAALDQYILKLQDMRNFIHDKRVAEMKRIMKEANKIKSVLEGITNNPK